MAKDYYAQLEVSRSADAKEIKTSYRKLARKYHPDVNPNDKAAESRFKEISEAYEVLSDPEKRKLYDQHGSNWEAAKQYQQQGGDPSHVNFDYGFQGAGTQGAGFESIFDQFFHGGGMEERPTNRVEPRDLEKTVELNLSEIDAGAKRTLTYQAMDACKSCDGTGTVQLRASRECPNCGGSGKVRNMIGFSGSCPVCHGTGRSALESCPTCSGAGTTATTKKVEITIPAGFPEGKKLRVPGRGVIGTGGRAGDLYVSVRETPNDLFRRAGDNLEVDVEVPCYTAALGGEIKVPTLRKTLTMKIPSGSQTGQIFRLSEQGITKMGGKRGDLMARLKVTVPKTLTEEQRQLFESLAELEKSPV